MESKNVKKPIKLAKQKANAKPKKESKTEMWHFYERFKWSGTGAVPTPRLIFKTTIKDHAKNYIKSNYARQDCVYILYKYVGDTLHQHTYHKDSDVCSLCFKPTRETRSFVCKWIFKNGVWTTSNYCAPGD